MHDLSLLLSLDGLARPHGGGLCARLRAALIRLEPRADDPPATTCPRAVVIPFPGERRHDR
ncbi:MAG: hypothetical protein EA355_15330 [Rhodobacteraceae bacterium]|nr:MAG: hypothetical protein EA355_15330 [Paracoccaceae bacterium]